MSVLDLLFVVAAGVYVGIIGVEVTSTISRVIGEAAAARKRKDIQG